MAPVIGDTYTAVRSTLHTGFAIVWLRPAHRVAEYTPVVPVCGASVTCFGNRVFAFEPVVVFLVPIKDRVKENAEPRALSCLTSDRGVCGLPTSIPAPLAPFWASPRHTLCPRRTGSATLHPAYTPCPHNALPRDAYAVAT